MKITYLYSLLLLFFLPLFSTQAAVCTSLSDGNWSNPLIWSCGNVPDEDNDVVVINHDVVLDQDVNLFYNNDDVLYSLTINAGASLIDNGTHTLQIGKGSNNGYNGINIVGLLDVYILTLEKAQTPISSLASTGEIIIRCRFDTSNRGDILVAGFLDIRGDWLLGNGNTEATGNGFILIEGCLDVGGGGSTDNIEPEYCIVRPNNGCLCGGNPSNAVDETDSNADGNGNNGGSRNECLVILPVIYLSFTGKVEESTLISNAKGILDWVTVSETNHKEFIVERSHEGKKFEEVGTLQAKGAKNTLTSYRFVDKNLEGGKLYYRLKEVSPSDEITYSPVVMLETKDDLFFKVFPNPISQGQKLHIHYPHSIHSLYIQNSQGQILFEQKQYNKTHSHLEIPINLPKGLYFIQIYTEERIIYRRLIVE